MEMYDSIIEIKKFPHANYKVNMAWHYIDQFLTGQPLVELNPDYQRGYVWTQEQKERYIEYRLMDGMSGRIIYWNCPNWQRDFGNSNWHNTLELVDGKQRLNAVFEFLDNKVKAFGKYLIEYKDADIMKRMRYDFEFHINNLSTKKEVVEWYLGLNNGGSIHTEDDLNIAKKILRECTNQAPVHH
jgi:hypothetical protein